jgi:phenylacetate-CoA ligase
MKFYPAISRLLYFFAQRLRKEPVWAELKKMDTEFFSSKEEIRTRVWVRGRDTLLYALKHVEYYRQYCLSDSLLQSVKKISSYVEFVDVLHKFPVMDKQIFIKHKELFSSDDEFTIDGYKTYSSGSTGEPVAFERDKRDWAKAHAHLIKILNLHGVEFGASYIYFWGGDWTTHDQLSVKIKNLIFNRIKIGAHNKSFDELAAQVIQIRSYQPRYIYSFPSCLERLCYYLQSTGDNLRDIGVQQVFTSGENLSFESRKNIEKAFGVSVCDIYGCSEFGLLAFDCTKGKKHVFMDTNFIEVSAEGKIMVTNLIQRKNVLVRYAIGDLCDRGVEWQECDCGLKYPVMGVLSGRDAKNYLLPNGNRVTSIAVTYIFDTVIFDSTILEGRFIVTEEGRVLLLLVPGQNFTQSTAGRLQSEGETLFGMPVRVKLVDKIPTHGNGKRVDFVSEWKL